MRLFHALRMIDAGVLGESRMDCQSSAPHSAVQDAVGGQESAAHEHLPDVLDALMVLADQQGFEVFDHADDRQLAPTQARLADSRDASVRDEQIVSCAGVNAKRCGYL
jgi:hypothetical protein